jgi:hypothetical protein
MRHINIIVDKIKYIKSAYPDYYSHSKSEKVWYHDYNTKLFL